MAIERGDTDGPTLGEVFRLVSGLATQMGRLEDRMNAEWLTKEVYDVRHRELEGRVIVLEERNRRAEARKFTVYAGLVTLFGSNIVTIVLAVTQRPPGH